MGIATDRVDPDDYSVHAYGRSLDGQWVWHTAEEVGDAALALRCGVPACGGPVKHSVEKRENERRRRMRMPSSSAKFQKTSHSL